MPRAAGESWGDVSYTAMNSPRAGQLTQFPHRAQGPCSEHPGQTQDAGGCEKGPGRWPAQSPDPMGKCVSASSINARLRAGSPLAQFFHVYCSYGTTLTKRGLHKWFWRGRVRTQPIVKAAVSTTRHSSDLFPTLQPLALKLSKLLRRFLCSSADPLGKRDWEPHPVLCTCVQPCRWRKWTSVHTDNLNFVRSSGWAVC